MLSADAALRPTGLCPLCGAQASASQGVVETQLVLLTCRRCRAFVMEKRLIDIIANARVWNLRPVLQHVAHLSRAAQQAADDERVLLITSTNWIRLATTQQRRDDLPVQARVVYGQRMSR